MEAQIFKSEGLAGRQTDDQMISIRRLALGILLQSYRDLYTPLKQRTKETEIWKKDSFEWFFSNETDPGSFLWVCGILGIEPKPLKEKAKKMIRDYKFARRVRSFHLQIGTFPDNFKSPA